MDRGRGEVLVSLYLISGRPVKCDGILTVSTDLEEQYTPLQESGEKGSILTQL